MKLKQEIKVGDKVELKIKLILPLGFNFRSGTVLKIFEQTGMALILAPKMPNRRFSTAIKNLRKLKSNRATTRLTNKE
jgi:hypothetical protein